MKNSWITFYFEQINKSNIYYVRISVYFRANWLHSFSQFLFVIGNSPFFNIEKFPKFLNPSRLITPYFLSFFFLRIFHKFLKFFFAEENFERFVLTRYEAAAWFFPKSDRKVVRWNRIDWSATGWWNSRFFSKANLLRYDAFLRNIPERYSILPTCLLNLFAVIS